MPANDNQGKRVNVWYEKIKKLLGEQNRPYFYHLNVNPVADIIKPVHVQGVNQAEWRDVRQDDPPQPILKRVIEVEEGPYRPDENERTEAFIKELQEQYPSLHLAGSRWFERRDQEENHGAYHITTNHDTDYDLFIEATENGDTWLKSQGFDQIDWKHYNDEYSKALWVHEDYPLIQITTRWRADAYKWAITNMDLPSYKLFGWKSSPVKPTKERIQKLFKDWTRQGIRVIDGV